MKTGIPRGSFSALLGTQSLTVFNDNLFKQVVLLLAVAAQVGSSSGFDLQALSGLAFSLPFVFFAATAGDVADRFRKRDVLLAAKWAEVGVMLFATLAFTTGSFAAVIMVLFLMGSQSAFLGPAKYGSMVEHFEPPELGRANGIMQATVLASVILGMGAAGLLLKRYEEHLWVLGLIYTAVAATGVLVAWKVHPQPPADAGRRLRLNPWLPVRTGLARAAQVPGLRPAILGHGLYWLLGGVLVFAWNEMGSKVLLVDSTTWTLRLASLSLSSAAGCLAAGALSRRCTGTWLPLCGGLGLAASFFAVALGPRDPLFIWICLLAGSFSGGFYLIPLRTLIQRLPPREEIGRTLGTSQLTDWVFIVAASLLKQFSASVGLDVIDLFWVLGAILCLALFPLAARLPAMPSAPASPPPPEA